MKNEKNTHAHDKIGQITVFAVFAVVKQAILAGKEMIMTEKNELVPGGSPWQKGNDQPVIEPEIIEPEVIEPEVVETDEAEKEGQESRRPAVWGTEFQRWFGVPPFPLTAAKLKLIVRRIDRIGPMQLGAFYPARLHKECALLLPHPVYGFNDWGYFTMIKTWGWNIGFFRCSAIGQVLEIYQIGERCHADCKTGKK